MLSLKGDRFIEWSFIIDNLPLGMSVLDIGCNDSIIPVSSCLNGNTTLGLDLVSGIPFKHDSFIFLCIDFLKAILIHKYDCVVLCSTLEHIGLAGRYNSVENIDGDILAMKKVFDILEDDSCVLLTIPVGIDSLFRPFHRVYGTTRLPLILEGFSIARQDYWAKLDGINWEKTSRNIALETPPSANYYALGLFILKKRSTDSCSQKI